MAAATPVRIVLVGAPGSAFRLAAEMARDMGAEVAMADGLEPALTWVRREGGDLVMIDVDLDVAALIAQLRSERHAVPVLACGINASASRAVAAIRAGAYDYIPLPPQRDLIAAAIHSIGHRSSSLLGSDPALLRAVEFAGAVAASNASILLSGEKGTGKEMLARHIHQSSRRPGRFLVVDCAGVGAEVVESELFGHAAGAFPGAVAVRNGRLNEAGDGTVLLRGVEALAPITQARLVAAIQDGCIHPLGGGEAKPLTARILASTSADLAAMVEEGRFRADLLARLALVRIELPPLRARKADIALLASHFQNKVAQGDSLARRAFTEEALKLLLSYAWPGNIRELEDVVHRAMLLATGESIGAEAIVLADGSRIVAAEAPADFDLKLDGLIGRSMADVERELILQTLERCGGNRTSASSILGISVRTMRNKLRSFIEAGIPVSPAL